MEVKNITLAQFIARAFMALKSKNYITAEEFNEYYKIISVDLNNIGIKSDYFKGGVFGQLIFDDLKTFAPEIYRDVTARDNGERLVLKGKNTSSNIIKMASYKTADSREIACFRNEQAIKVINTPTLSANNDVKRLIK